MFTVIVFVLVAPTWVVYLRVRDYLPVTPSGESFKSYDLIKLENDVRTALIQAVGGALVIIGAYSTWQNLKFSQKTAADNLDASKRTIEQSDRGRVAERFSKSIEQLGSERDDRSPRLEIRLGAVYSLGNIAKEYSDYHWSVMEILCAYIRGNSSTKISAVLHKGWLNQLAESSLRKLKSKHARSTKGKVILEKPIIDDPRADIQAILRIICFRNATAETTEQILDLSHSNISKVDLKHGNLKGANLQAGRLVAANLEGASLEQANLLGADLQEAKLDDANLERADLIMANLRGARLHRANLRGASLGWARLNRTPAYRSVLGTDESKYTDLAEAKLAGANLERAELEDAHLFEADLRGANLYEATLTGADLSLADLRPLETETGLRVTTLVKADVSGTIFDRAHLEEADLRETVGLTWAQLERSYINAQTQLPPRVDGAIPDDIRAELRAGRSVCAEDVETARSVAAANS